MKPEAIRLAEWIEADMTCDGDAEIASELRRLQSRIDELEKDATARFDAARCKALFGC